MRESPALPLQECMGQEVQNRRELPTAVRHCSSTCLQTPAYVRSSGVATEVSTRTDLRDFVFHKFNKKERLNRVPEQAILKGGCQRAAKPTSENMFSDVG